MLERMICSCGIPMKCIDSSVPVVYNQAVVYFGSKFACPSCKAAVVAITAEESMCIDNFILTDNTVEVID
jgi:hypothetical protein